MELYPLLLQSGGSLLAILALAGLAVLMKLGGKPVLSNPEAVAHAASEVEDGFQTMRSSIARGGTAALARDASGRIMVIKRHGNKFVGRILTRTATCREQVDALMVNPGEAPFGTVRLSLDDGSYWADAINRL